MLKQKKIFLSVMLSLFWLQCVFFILDIFLQILSNLKKQLDGHGKKLIFNMDIRHVL